MSEQNYTEVSALIKWFEYLKFLMVELDKVPKKYRFTLVNRMFDLALDVQENLIDAKFSQRKSQHLREINLSIEKMRFLNRILFEIKAISNSFYERSSRGLNDFGKMIGGWIRYEKQGKAAQ